MKRTCTRCDNKQTTTTSFLESIPDEIWNYVLMPQFNFGTLFIFYYVFSLVSKRMRDKMVHYFALPGKNLPRSRWSSMMTTLICDNSLALFNFFQETHKILLGNTYMNWDIIDFTCCEGHIEILKWLLKEITKEGGNHNYPGGVGTMHTRIGLTQTSFVIAVRNGNCDMVKWIYESKHFKIDDSTDWQEDACYFAAKYGHIDLLQFLKNEYYFEWDTTKTLFGAIKFGSIANLYVLKKMGVSMSRFVTSVLAIMCKKLDILIWSQSNLAEFKDTTGTDFICDTLLYNDEMYPIEKGYTLYYGLAIRRSSVDILDWLHKNMSFNLLNVIQQQHLILIASYQGNDKIRDWFLSNGIKIETKESDDDDSLFMDDISHFNTDDLYASKFHRIT